MIKRVIQKTVRGFGIFLAMIGVATLRFAIYTPELLSDIFRTIGG